MMLENARIFVVTRDPAGAGAFVAALEAEGARATLARHPEESFAALADAPDADGVLVVAGDDPGAYAALFAQARAIGRTGDVPIIVAVEPSAAVDAVAITSAVAVAGPPIAAVWALDAAIAPRRELAAAVARERALAARLERVEQRLAALDASAHEISHDGRALLGVVVGYAANLRDGLAGPVDERQRAHLSRVKEAADDVAALLARHAHASSAEPERQASEPAPPPAAAKRAARRSRVAVADLVRSVVGLLDDTIREHEQTVAVDLDESLVVWGDELALRQCLVNLVSNASKYTPRGGTIAVTAGFLPGEGRGAAARRRARVVIADSGPGIPPAESVRVFERGVRLERDATSHPGSGVGLSVVHRIVGAHGGRVSVADGPLGGAAFTIDLPVDARGRERRGIVLSADLAAIERLLAIVDEGAEGVEARAIGDADAVAILVEGADAKREIDALVARFAKLSEVS